MREKNREYETTQEKLSSEQVSKTQSALLTMSCFNHITGNLYSVSQCAAKL